MKLRINIFPIFLSIFIFIFSVLQCNILVYASEGVYPAGTSKLEKVLTEVSTYLVYLATRVEAIVDGDFAKWVQNREDFKQWWNTGHISYDEKSDSVLFDDDLVNYIKQALKEYAEENMGFWIMPTIDFRLLSGSSFSSNNEYQTLKNIVNEKGIVVYSKRNYGGGSVNVLIPDIYSHDIPMVYICTSSSYDPSSITNSYGCPTAFYGADTWTILSSTCYSRKVDEIYTTYDEYKSGAGISTISGEREISDFYTNASSMVHTSSGKHRFYLVSKDGRRVQVFKSLDAYKNHDTGTRRVYFGSKFYEDTGAVTGSYDDLINWLDGKYDDLWDRLGDLIGDDTRLSEDELEKIVDKLIDRLDEIGDKIEDGNKETNNLLQKILDALNKLDATVASALSGSGSGSDMSGIEGYLERILLDLDYIVYQMEEQNEEEFQQKTDDMFDEVQMTFADLGEIAKTKFPLSIPWDIDSMLSVLSGENSKEEEKSSSFDTMSISSFESDEFIAVGKAYDLGISLAVEDPEDISDEEDTKDKQYISGAFMSSNGNPIFLIPFVLSERLDIYEYILINMDEFESLSKLSRSLFTCIFAMYLVRLSFDVVGLGKDVFD